MPRVTEEHLAARRRQILDAAVTCFARQGLHRTTMQDIFREAELSPGAVYRYFPSKEAILRAIAEEAFGNVARVIRQEAPATFRDTALEPYRLLAELPLGTPEERVRLIVQPAPRSRCTSGSPSSLRKVWFSIWRMRSLVTLKV